MIPQWSDVRDAIAFGNQAVQLPLPPCRDPKFSGDEDCLTLNIWAPATRSASPRPVMVWIHGGGFMKGSSSEPQYNGLDYAVRGDLIFVSINYRLGGFGYLLSNRDPASANLGLLDQIAALEWVRDNIQHFGGDPTNVTVMGESAGGMSIGIMLGAPAAQGLFHRAIIQSGGARPVYGPNEPAKVQQELLELALKHDDIALRRDDIDSLINLPAADLNKLFAQLAAASDSILLGGEAFQPAMDNFVLPKHPLENLSPVPTLIGGCENEGMFFSAIDHTLLLNGLRRKVRSKIEEDHWKKIVKTYQATERRDRPWRIDLFSDMFTNIPSLCLANGLKALGAPVWMYRFEYAHASECGACHASDIAFTFGAPQDTGPLKTRWDNTAEVLSTQMRDSYIAFARHGNPSTECLGHWPEYDPATLSYMRFDAPCSIGEDALGEARRAVWDGVRIDAL